jgi:hypothetical protein
MYKDFSVCVVIPTLNEEKGIVRTLELIPQFVDEIIIVDGDSKDKTRDLASEWAKIKSKNVKIIIEKRRGYGRAFKTGFENSVSQILVSGDGDGTYPIELIDKAIDFLLNEDLAFVSCNRLPLEDKSSMHFQNHFGNYALTFIASLLFFHKFKDILSGMWVFKRECLKKMALFSDSWNFSEEIKIQAYLNFGDKFQEFKIPYRERLGETKLVPWKVGIENLIYMIALRFNCVAFCKKFLEKSKN